MSYGEDSFDALAHALVDAGFEFDAVERDGLRAEWTEEGDQVEVRALGSDEVAVYSGEDLVRAASDTEVRNAREPAETTLED